MIPITNYRSIYEVEEESILTFTNMPRNALQRHFNKLIDEKMAEGSNSHIDKDGNYVDDIEITLPAGACIKIVKLKISNAAEENERYYWNDFVKFSILHPSLKGLQFKTVGRYDVKIHGRDNMKQLSKLKTKELMD